MSQAVLATRNAARFTGEISSLTKAAKWQQAVRIFAAYESLFGLDIRATSAVLGAWQRGSSWTQAVALFQRAKTLEGHPRLYFWQDLGRDTVGFSSLAWAYERATQWRRVLALLQEMPRHGVPPNAITVTAALRALGRSGGQWPAMLQLVERSRESKLLDRLGLEALAAGLLRSGCWERALSVLRTMPGLPSLASCSMMTSCFAKAAMWRDAVAVLLNMGDSFLQPNSIMINSLFSNFEVASQWTRSLHLLQSARQSELRVDAVGLTAALLSCEESGRGAAAWTVLREFTFQELLRRPLRLHIFGHAPERIVGERVAHASALALRGLLHKQSAIAFERQLLQPLQTQLAPVRSCRLGCGSSRQGPVLLDTLDLGASFSKEMLSAWGSSANPVPGRGVLDLPAARAPLQLQDLSLPARPAASVLGLFVHVSLFRGGVGTPARFSSTMLFPHCAPKLPYILWGGNHATTVSLERGHWWKKEFSFSVPGRKSARVQGIRGNAEQLSAEDQPVFRWLVVGEDFISNNRGINEGEDIPQDVQSRVFESIRQDEIKTPSSGSLIEGISRARWEERTYQYPFLEAADQYAAILITKSRLPSTFEERLEGQLLVPGVHQLSRAGTGIPSAPGPAAGLELLLRLSLQLRRPEADSAAESLFFFGAEVFHDAQSEVALVRGSNCLHALFRTALGHLTGMSTKQLHLLVYLTVQFAVYGLLDRASPALDSATTKLLLCPTLLVDPPTGVVYSFLRKISTAPFKMLSFVEDGPVPTSGAKDAPQGSAVRSASAPVHVDEEGSPEAPTPAVVAEDEVSDHSQSEGGSASPAVPEQLEEEVSEGSLQGDPLQPQIQQAFQVSELELLLKALVMPWREAPLL
eukprot:s2375_g8.t2